MPKQSRKRRHDATTSHLEFEVKVKAPKNKFRPYTEEMQAEEEQLSKILFGGAPSFLRSLEEAEQEAGPSNIDSGVGEDDSDESEMKEPSVAWYDEDDGIEVGQALDAQGRKLPSGGINDRDNKYHDLLKNKFANSYGNSWTPRSRAKPKSQDSSDSDDEILRSCGFIRKSTSASLPQTVLEYKKVKDLNCETYSEGPIVTAVEFHPKSSAALITGKGGIASLYAVDGRRNNKLHSIAFEHYPINCAKFAQDGNEAILGSGHSHIFSYDLTGAKAVRVPLPPGMTNCKKFVVSPDSNFLAVAGKWGEVHLLTAASKERVAVLKQNSEITAMDFNPRGDLLYGHSDTGEVTVWDLNMRRVRHKFIDEGCLQGTTLAISSSNQFLASGSAQGVVNLYGIEDVLQSKLPKPRKTILNLTTSITDLKFNSTSELLAMSSVDIKNSVKLFHVGSGTVFSNFPSFGAKLGHVNVLNFSPGSGFIAFGSRKSAVALYRLKHFKNY